MKEAVVFIADTHINSKVGLCSPNVQGDDGDGYEPNVIQRWLWNTWLTCIHDIKSVVGDSNVTLVLDGDVVDLDPKNRSDQMISKNPATVLKIVDDVFSPLLEISKKLYVVRGTEAHSGTSAWSEEAIAHRFRAIKDDSTQQFSRWHLRGVIGGVRFDIAHHASMGTLPWTYSNMVMRLVQETRFDYFDWGDCAPDVVVRAHQHRYADSGTTFPTRGVFLPCWQYKPVYLYRIGRNTSKPNIGAVVCICENGKYDLQPLLYAPLRDSPWKNL